LINREKIVRSVIRVRRERRGKRGEGEKGEERDVGKKEERR